MNRTFKAIIFIFVLYLCAVKTYSQSKEFTVIEPKPYQCIIIGSQLKMLWKVPASQDKKNKMSVSIKRGKDVLLLKKDILFAKGECLVHIPSRLTPGVGYTLVFQTQQEPVYKKSVGHLFVSISKWSMTGASPSTLQNLALDWKPSIIIDSDKIKHIALNKLKNRVITISPIEDKRKYQSWIGGYYTGKQPKCLALTKDTISQWMENKLNALFNDLGIRTGKEGKMKISISILDFYVRESETYKSEIVVYTTLLNQQKETIWKGILRGFAGDWGKTRMPEIYQKCIADSFLRLAISLLENISLYIDE